MLRAEGKNLHRPLGILGIAIGCWVGQMPEVMALPPATEVPEEVLRTEIILEARSPLDGKPLTAADYVQLQAQLEAEQQATGQVPPKIRDLIALLRLRRDLRKLFPSLDF